MNRISNSSRMNTRRPPSIVLHAMVVGIPLVLGLPLLNFFGLLSDYSLNLLGKYLSLFILLYAVLRSEGVAWSGMSFWKTVLGLTGAEMTSALPIKGLAGFGTWESAWSAALLWMGFDPRLAVLSGLGVHLVTNLFEYALALGSLAVLAFRRKRDRMGRNP